MAAGPVSRPRGEAAPLPEIPGYRIESVLGRGSTGVVYRAVQLAVERVVALKVLHRSLSRGRIVRRLQREARTTARLSHPNVVAAIDMGTTGGLWWYAMEFVDGPSLAAHLRRKGRLSEREALRLFIPLCEALEHLHHSGVVHRDIKPGNVLVEGGARARLVDLGLAFAEDDPSMTSQGGTLGTPHYVSPEQARNSQAADVRSDIWSLGASLYHAVCGRPPFAGASVADILSAVLYARIPDPGELQPGLSRGLRLVLRKCLARDPAGRYQTPSELRDDLERLRERRQVTVQRRELDPLEGHEERMRRLWTGAAVGAIALLGIGLALWRPWASGARPATEPSATHYEDLEDVADRIRLGGRMYASVLTELDAMRSVVPPEFAARWREVREEALRRYDAEVSRLSSSFQQEFARLLERREFSDAQALLDDLELRARRELNPSAEQLARINSMLMVETRRAELETAVAGALLSVERRVRDDYERRVFARVDWKLERNQWRGALEVLQVGVAERLTQGRIETAGLPEGRLGDLLERIRTQLVTPRIESLDDEWRRFDEELVSWVDERADALEGGLSGRTRERAARALRSEWEAHLREIGLERDEMLESTLASLALDRRARKLRRLESQYEVEDAGLLLQERLRELEPLWTARDYRGLAREWARLRDLPHLAPERAAIDLQVLEARLLEELLEQAAGGLRTLASTGEEALLFVGSIGVQGRIETGDDPLGTGFRLRPSGSADTARVFELGLRALKGVELLRPDDVEQLAGLPGAGAPLEPREGLVRGLFRSREGDLEAAAAVLPLGALGDAELERLATELSRRVGASATASDVDQRERLEQAKTLIKLINRVRLADVTHARDIADTVAKIDRVLHEFGDLEYVRVRRVELQYTKDCLTEDDPPVAEEDFRSGFGASEVQIAEGSRTVRMGFDFDAETHGGPWDAGDWVVASDGDGWQAPGVRSRAQLLESGLWPRLVLRQPLDLEDRLSVELELDQLRDSGPPVLLVVSVAGVHVGFLGDEHGRAGRWLTASGGPEHLHRLLEGLLDGAEGQSFAGLERGARHRVRIELTQGRGRAEVFLDDQLLDVDHQPRPGGEPGTASVVVRSIEVLRLVSARVEGSYASR